MGDIFFSQEFSPYKFKILQHDYNALVNLTPKQRVLQSYKTWEASNRNESPYEVKQYLWHVYLICRENLFSKLPTDHLNIPN